MKTTIDLPPDLVREMKLRAVHEGRKLKDVAADLLKRGLRAGNSKPASLSPKDFLLSAPASAPEMTPERVRQILEETP
ncbi:antitoxin [Akkermansiaceae bacterium]|nr:antitoxin [Akkermansiaceae bacterium]